MSNVIVSTYIPLQPLPSPRVLELPEHPRYPAESFEPHVTQALRAAFRGEVPWPLVFLGKTGAGKTTASLVLLDHCGGRRWLFTQWLKDLEAARTGQLWASGHKIGVPDLWNKWIGGGQARHYPPDYPGFCVMDDVGLRSERDTPSTHGEILHRCLDERTNKPTLYITNRSLDQLSELFGRTVYSRLNAGTKVEFRHADRRSGKWFRAGGEEE